MKNKINQLNKAYKRRLKYLNKNMLSTDESGLLVFVEYLKYLRDTHVLTQGSTDAIKTLTAAIEEFNTYQKNKKEFHWNNFWEFVKLNMKEWLIVNDSV